jgi:S1/P1 Nuclease
MPRPSVGDVHRPLHESFKDDRGRNAALDQGPRGEKLDAVWYKCIIERRVGRDVSHVAAELRARVTDGKRADWTGTRSKAWANESFTTSTAATVRYRAGTETGCWYEEDHEILDLDEEKSVVTADEANMDAHLPTIGLRLTQAGIRLGHLLNLAFGRE